MKILPIKSFIILVCLSVLWSILFGQMLPTSVRADVGVHPILPGGSNIKPEEGTPIQMAAETVVMTIRQATEADNALIKLNPDAYGLQFQPVWFSAIAEVKADFIMKNPTSDMVGMIAWFPLASALENISWEINPDEIVPSIESFHIMVDAKAIDYTVSELPNPKGAERPLLPWASFPLTFPANKETTIQVSYLLPLVPSVKGNVLALYYVFQTGSGWAGSIGQAELILNLPYPASEETMADMTSGNLNLPYIMANVPAGMPLGVNIAGNQARWEWKDFEPSAQDDFSIWLINPIVWKELEAARAELQLNPEDGQAWLDLASIYHSLSTVGYNFPSVFSNTYLPLGIEVYQEAIGRLPEHPAPHAGLALLLLAPYMHGINTPPEVMKSIQDELMICRELEARNPSLAEGADLSSWLVEDALSMYSPNATATAEWYANSTAWVQKTLDTATTPIPTSMPQVELTPTSVTAPKNTALLQPTATPIPMLSTDSGLNLLVLATAGIVGVIFLGYFVSRRIRARAS